VGLGADGLSSSSYGPEEAFKNLGDHQYLAVFLAALTAITVVVIAAFIGAVDAGLQALTTHYVYVPATK